MANEKINVHVREIKEQQKYYDFFKKLPKIMFWAMIIIGVIVGIVVEVTVGAELAAIFICGLFGAVAGAISYFLINS